MDYQLSISTITEVIKTNCSADLASLYNIFEKSQVIDYDQPTEGIIKLAWNRECKGTCKKDTLYKKSSTSKTFQNQLAAYVRHLREKNINLNRSGRNIEIEYAKTITQIHRVTMHLSRPYTGRLVFAIDRTTHSEHVVEGQKEITVCADAVVRVRRHLGFQFDEEVTIERINIAYPQEVSIFLFASGNCKLSGVRSLDDTPHTMQLFWDGLHRPEHYFEHPTLCIHSRSTSLINTDFTAGFALVRERLFKHIVSDYDVESNYDPDVHPAIQIRYYCNDAYDGGGRCRCVERGHTASMVCRGKGSGSGLGECKIITNLIFQSGKVIITGGRAMHHVHQSFGLICELLNKYRDDINR